MNKDAKEKSALDFIHPDGGFEWEWPAVFVLIILAIIWLCRAHAKNKTEQEQAAKLCRDSLEPKSN